MSPFPVLIIRFPVVLQEALMQLEGGENASAFCIASVVPPFIESIEKEFRNVHTYISCVTLEGNAASLVCLLFHLRVLSLFQVWQESGSRPKL